MMGTMNKVLPLWQRNSNIAYTNRTGSSSEVFVRNDECLLRHPLADHPCLDNLVVDLCDPLVSEERVDLVLLDVEDETETTALS